MNEVYLLIINDNGNFISLSLYEKRETAEKAADSYMENRDEDKCRVTVTSLNVIMG